LRAGNAGNDSAAVANADLLHAMHARETGAIGNATAAKNTQRFSVVNSALAPENNI
jgi:hypothetical protein